MLFPIFLSGYLSALRVGGPAEIHKLKLCIWVSFRRLLHNSCEDKKGKLCMNLPKPFITVSHVVLIAFVRMSERASICEDVSFQLGKTRRLYVVLSQTSAK